jgi:hypothetical protein
MRVRILVSVSEQLALKSKETHTSFHCAAMIRLYRKILPLVLVLLLHVSVSFSQRTEPTGGRVYQEKLAVLPFELRGISPEEGLLLTQRFAGVFAESKRFDVMPQDTMKSIFAEAAAKLEGCNYSYCLADLGKVLGVHKVIHVDASRRGKLYVLHIRLVNVENAALLYDERVDYSGELTALLSDVLAEQAQKLAGARLDEGTRWYIIAAAILAGVGAIYWIYKSFNSQNAEENSGKQTPPIQQ